MFDRKHRYLFCGLLFSFVMLCSVLFAVDITAKSLDGVQLASKSGSIVIGQKLELKVKNLPKGSRIAYQISKPSIASVSKKGYVTGKKAGSATISVAVSNGAHKAKLHYKLTVKKPQFSASSITVGLNKRKTLSIVNKPQKTAKAAYDWSSDNTKVAVVKNGKVTGKAYGIANIKVKITAGRTVSYTLKCKVRVGSSGNAGNRKPDFNAWKEAYNWNNHSKLEKKNGMLIIRNNKAGIGMFTQTVTVKPYTDYRIRALVRVKNYKKGNENPGGVTVGYGTPEDASCYETDFVRTNQWTQSEVYFNSGKNKKITLRVANGGYNAISKGTAYIKDIELEEASLDNKWNVLTLIYQNVETKSFKNSFSDAQIEDIKTILQKLPDTVRNLSGGRMLIGAMDTKVIQKSVKSISGSYGDLTCGAGKDINFDSYLKGKDYNQVVVFAPIAENPVTKEQKWYGLGGTSYKGAYYCIINRTMSLGNPDIEIKGNRYDARIAVLTHEMLHCVENNSRKRGWTEFAPLHDYEKHGYTYSPELELLDWQMDLMRDTIKSGAKGFLPESFYVPHFKK